MRAISQDIVLRGAFHQRDTVKVGGDALASLQTNAARQDKHDAKMHDMFEQRLRELSENPNNIMTAMVCQRFEEEMLQQHQQAQDGAMAALTSTIGKPDCAPVCASAPAFRAWAVLP